MTRGISLSVVAFAWCAGLTAYAATLDERTAGRFAALALACVQKEYPNKIAHVLNSPDDVKSPRELTPAFYGCFDWHSSVHGHWLLARLVRVFPSAPFAAEAIDRPQGEYHAVDHCRRGGVFQCAPDASRSSARTAWPGCCS